MKSSFNQMVERFDPRFKIFHELMRIKVREVLLVSTPYDAWIMEEDCRLSEAIVHEYRGLNLSHPPRFHWVSSAEAAQDVTFAPLLKYNSFPLAPLLKATLDIGREGMGCPVEMEFSAELNPEDGGKPQFAVLQLRPITLKVDGRKSLGVLLRT